MENENQREDGVVFNLKDLLATMYHKKGTIALILILCIAVSLAYGIFFVKPTYVSSTKIYVLGTQNVGTGSGGISSTELVISTYLVSDYAELVSDRTVIEQVIKELHLDASYEQIKSMVSVNVPDDSRVIQLMVTSSNPKLSKAVADKICSVMSKQVYDFLGVDKVNQFGKANLPTSSSSISPVTCGMLGLLAGVVISIIFSFIYLYTNDQLKTDEEVERFLGICTLAHIPYNAARDTKAHGRRKSRKHR